MDTSKKNQPPARMKEGLTGSGLPNGNKTFAEVYGKGIRLTEEEEMASNFAASLFTKEAERTAARRGAYPRVREGANVADISSDMTLSSEGDDPALFDEDHVSEERYLEASIDMLHDGEYGASANIVHSIAEGLEAASKAKVYEGAGSFVAKALHDSAIAFLKSMYDGEDVVIQPASDSEIASQAATFLRELADEIEG